MPSGIQKTPSHISTLNEKSLHAELKAWYAQPGDLCEACLDGFIIDIVKDNLLVEVQTKSFSAIRRKLARLIERHPVRLVYPIARDKWIVKQNEADGGKTSRRKSPKRGQLEHVFLELVSLPHLLIHANFSLEILFIEEEEIRRPNPRRGWHRKVWVTHERRLLSVLGRRLFESPADFAALIPATLAGPFTTADLATTLSIPQWLAQKMAYCLRVMNAIQVAGKKGNAVIYKRTA